MEVMSSSPGACAWSWGPNSCEERFFSGCRKGLNAVYVGLSFVELKTCAQTRNKELTSSYNSSGLDSVTFLTGSLLMHYFQNLTGSLPVRYCKNFAWCVTQNFSLAFTCALLYTIQVYFYDIQVSFCIYKYNFEFDALMLKSCTGMDF